MKSPGRRPIENKPNPQLRYVPLRSRFPPRFRIEVNRPNSEAPLRFTLAREVSHCLLHHEQIADGIADVSFCRSAPGDHSETETNKLAAELTIPARLARTF
jgi:Zn-dependent peptidase ImmA (M78 family)